MTVYFPNNVIAHINVNWLSPVKVRTTLIGGEKKMLVVERPGSGREDQGLRQGRRDHQSGRRLRCLVSYRSGDMWSPKVEATEALKAELTYFVDCVKNGQRPFNDGDRGLRVVRMLEAAEALTEARGEAVYA